MKKDDQTIGTLSEIIHARRTTRSFSTDVPPVEEMEEILRSAIFAPFGRATGLPPKEIRKIFVFSQGTESMKQARELLLMEIRQVARKVKISTTLFPFLKKRMGLFAERISVLERKGIPGLSDAPYYIVVATRKGFPAMEKQTIAHAMQNMWLSATAQGLGFQPISQTGMMSKNKAFMQLLGLKTGDYELDGCVIGMQKTAAEPREERQLADFVTWVR
jgi:nitroreductase